MTKEDVQSSESEIRRASKRGAVEDIIHVGSRDEGYDLKVNNNFGAGIKQEVEWNGKE
ncbi:hypothetical protein SM124_14810 [Bacillus sp. 31A1R]|uniref:Uncharacterized protein n=1 Tax=Robertmurraya mangrovi TaxID=3098077 RepID=A0ABU5J0Q7_9BACI|nr:hypothetical protein [Bacillus sp. 31A1R]MDZ5472986.1 hypothetical protein [Bacillus sp. 31A1R]